MRLPIWAEFAAVVFLILSGITGYLIEPYSTLASDPLLLNKSHTALAALYFWAAFVFIRYWSGPRIVAKSRFVRSSIHHLHSRDGFYHYRGLDRCRIECLRRICDGSNLQCVGNQFQDVHTDPRRRLSHSWNYGCGDSSSGYCLLDGRGVKVDAQRNIVWFLSSPRPRRSRKYAESHRCATK